MTRVAWNARNVAGELRRLPLLGVLLLIPFHTLIVAHVLPERLGVRLPVLAMWKEALLLTTFCAGTVATLTGRPTARSTPLDLSVLLFLAYALLSVPFAPSSPAALYGVRNYGEAFVALALAARFLPLSEEGIWRLGWGILGVAAAISVWAIFQSTYLGPAFLLANGYGRDGALSASFFVSNFSFQRAIGTFGSPTVFGLYLAVVILVVTDIGRMRRAREAVWVLALGILVAALLATLSRSAVLGLLVGIGVRRWMFPQVQPRVRSEARPLLLATGAALLVLASVSSYVTALPQYLYRTLTLQDSSAQGHIRSVAETLEFVRHHPFGVGIGQAGPRALIYTGKLLNAESSVLTVAVDVGVIGSLLYWAMWAATLVALRRAYVISSSAGAWTSAELCRGAFAAVCAAATACIVLPLNVEVELMLVIFLLAGAALASAREAGARVAAPTRQASHDA